MIKVLRFARKRSSGVLLATETSIEVAQFSDRPNNCPEAKQMLRLYVGNTETHQFIVELPLDEFARISKTILEEKK